MEPGDVVVCVDARPSPYYGPNNLIEGRSYRVEKVSEIGEDSFGRMAPGIWVSGAVSASSMGFSGARFRPLRPNEQSAREQWAEMLRTEPVLNPHSKERV